MTKKGDYNPSIVFGLYGKPKTIDECIKKIDSRKGMRVREFRLIDVGFELDDTTEENINWIKSFAMPMLKRFVDKIPFKSIIEKQLEKQGLKLMKYETWKHDSSHELLYSGLTPIAIDIKYKDKYTDDEKKILDKLTKFESNFIDEQTRLKDKIDKDLEC